MNAAAPKFFLTNSQLFNLKLINYSLTFILIYDILCIEKRKGDNKMIIIIKDIVKKENVTTARNFTEAKAIKNAYEEDNENCIIRCYTVNPYSNFLKDVTELVNFFCGDNEY